MTAANDQVDAQGERRRRQKRMPWVSRAAAALAVVISSLAVVAMPAGADPPPHPAPIPVDLWSPPDAPASGSYLHLADPARTNTTVFGQGYQSDFSGPAFRVATDATASVPQTIITIWGGDMTQLQPGLYADVGGDDTPGTAALWIHQPTVSCANPIGWFAVDDVAYHGSELDRITFRFSQTCEGETQPRRGKVAWVGTPSVLTHTTSGPRRGGWPLHVLGDHLSEATSWTIDGQDVPFTVDPPVVTAIVPETSLGSHEVTLTTPGGSVDLAFESLPNPATAPLGLTTTVGKNSVALNWTEPADVGDAPVDLVQVWIRHAPGSGGPGKSTILASDDEPTAAFSQLQPGSTYLATVVYQTAIGLGEASTVSFTVPPIDHAPFVAEIDLVDEQYVDFTGRSPTPSERTAAVTAIREGTTTADAFVASMRNRPEWGGVRAPVTRLYSAYFGRLPDAAGLAFWSNKLRSGTSLARVSATFAASSEFKRKYGSLSNGAFVDLIYRNVLHRNPDAAGRTYWIRKLNAGTARGAAMASFSESSEHVRKLAPTVDTVLLYTGMLRRMPTTIELPAAPGSDARTATATTTDPVTLAEQLRHSAAYAARF